MTASDTLLKNPPFHRYLLIILTGCFMFIAFYVSPWEGADDWKKYYDAAQRLITGSLPLYAPPEVVSYNPPWVAVSAIPLSLFPPKFGWSALSVGTLALAILVLRKWEATPGIVKPLAVLSSPPMFYILLHGQIDLVVVAAVLLPQWVWPIAALTKPQVTIGLLLGIRRKRVLRAAVFSALVLGISFGLWGFWPTELTAQEMPVLTAGHNLWTGLWPFQIPLGVIFVLLGLSRSDERLLIAGSPFLSPYAAISTMIGPWIAATSFLRPWQVVVVWLSWWGAVVYRLIA